MNRSSKVVWARIRYCPYWPAQLISNPPSNLKIPSKKLCVMFFGSNNYGFVPTENVQSYVQRREKYINKGRGKLFSNAVEECDKFVAESYTAESSNDCELQPVGPIVLKRELDTGIKQENPSEEEFYSREIISVCSACSRKECEINHLTGDNLKLKSEIDELKVKLNQNQNEIDSLFKQIYELEAEKENTNTIEVSNLNKSIESLTNELQKYKHHYEQNHQIVLELSKENSTLKGQVKELSDKNCELNNLCYEVEKLLDHKWQRGKLMFLVRWKGYDCSHDSWEKRENLRCDRLLQSYLKKNKLN